MNKSLKKLWRDWLDTTLSKQSKLMSPVIIHADIMPEGHRSQPGRTNGQNWNNINKINTRKMYIFIYLI